MALMATMTAVPSYVQMQIPGMDGYRADRISLAFAGSVPLDHLNEVDLEFVERLRLGSPVTLTVQATVAGKGFSHSAKGDDEEVGYQVRLRVHSLS